MADRYFLQTLIGTGTPVPQWTFKLEELLRRKSEAVARRNRQRDAFQNDVLVDDIDALFLFPTVNAEGGWTTDTALAVYAFCLAISAIELYPGRDRDQWLWMYVGTGVSHAAAALAHRYLPNRTAPDRLRDYSFYIVVTMSYCGNCARYGFGWQTGEGYKIFAVANGFYIMLVACFVMLSITLRNRLFGVPDITKEQPIFLPDRFLAFGFIVCSVMEVVVPIVYAYENELNGYIIVAVVFNLIGWSLLYTNGFVYALTSVDADPGPFQRLFHYCMFIMLWAVDLSVRERQLEEA